MSRFTLDETPVISGILDTGDTVTVSIIDLSDGSAVALDSNSATEVGSTGTYRYTLDFTTKPTNANHYYEATFTGSLQTYIVLFEWSWDKSAYGDTIYIDVDAGSAGTAYPRGQPSDPVNNITDAKTIADSLGIVRFHVHGSITLNADFTGYIFESHSYKVTTIDLNGQIITNARFRDCTITGNAGGYEAQFTECYLGNMTNCNFTGEFCAFNGDLTVASGGSINFSRSSNAVANTININLNGDGSIGLVAHDGITNFTNMTNVASSIAITGNNIITLDSTITAGTVIIAGVGLLTNNSTSLTLLINKMLPDTVWEELLLSHVTSNTVGEAINDIFKIEKNRWRITGNQFIIYDDDDTTPIYTFDLKDASGDPTEQDAFERDPA